MTEHHHGEKLIAALKKDAHKIEKVKKGLDLSAQHLIESAEKLLPLLEQQIPWHAYSEEQVEHAKKLAKELKIGAVDYNSDKS